MAGKDATRLFKSLHPPGTLEEYAIDPTSLIDGSSHDSDEDAGKPRFVGLVDRDTIVALPMDEGKKEEGKEKERIPLAQIIGLPDFEVSRSGMAASITKNGLVRWSGREKVMIWRFRCLSRERCHKSGRVGDVKDRECGRMRKGCEREQIRRPDATRLRLCMPFDKWMCSRCTRGCAFGGLTGLCLKRYSHRVMMTAQLYPIAKWSDGLVKWGNAGAMELRRML